MDKTAETDSGQFMNALPGAVGPELADSRWALVSANRGAETQRLSSRAALLAIRFYQANLSVWFGGSCRFQPTCSHYAYEAISRFGLWRGSWLAFKRLLRCHPFSGRFGFDPVPEPDHETGFVSCGHHGVPS